MAANIRKRCSIVTLAAAIVAAVSATGHAAEEGIDKAKADAFDVRMLAKPPGNKAYACFVRRYDPEHLARHPLQKVRAMKLLITAEIPPDENTTNYSFRLGVKYRHRAGDFDSSGSCGHVISEDAGHEIRFGCGVDCDGGGIVVAMSKDDKSAIIRLERVRIWQNNKPDEEAEDSLVAGADDRIFRLDRVEARECASLVTDRKELAAIRHK
ncbi:hypothetical protein KMZ29_06555 [Bradyrhizobium sediminis]|uniref:Uncharacterized protein n=2 Tax=Bradyrhizobium sediminis TaxID=2840469 RepID=A0A975NIB3_9BRAD|nr:hypothetical protein KMZ29_06555 [Bradyrhizobium sediminis]